MINTITENFQSIRKSIPPSVTLVVACKSRTIEEVKTVISAGATDIGENYVQEAERIKNSLGEEAKKVKWHMIGNLQVNKMNKAIAIFDIIQTIDSFERAVKLNEKIKKNSQRILPILIEVNIANEPNKSGVKPDYKTIKELIEKISTLENLKIEGLMTMGPLCDNPEDIRPYFRKMKIIYEQLKQTTPAKVNLKFLSMGMSNSYKIAIEEGANMIRIGSAIFGKYTN